MRKAGEACALLGDDERHAMLGGKLALSRAGLSDRDYSAIYQGLMRVKANRHMARSGCGGGLPGASAAAAPFFATPAAPPPKAPPWPKRSDTQEEKVRLPFPPMSTATSGGSTRSNHVDVGSGADPGNSACAGGLASSGSVCLPEYSDDSDDSEAAAAADAQAQEAKAVVQAAQDEDKGVNARTHTKRRFAAWEMDEAEVVLDLTEE